MLMTGDRGPTVRVLQSKLVRLGYEPVVVDGVYGPITRWAVRNLQAMFGYTVDGVVGRGTARLIDAQIGYGWNARAATAQGLALKAQGLLKRGARRPGWS